MRRWLRVLICLLLVSCILVNLSPLKADATAAGLAGSIAGVTAVSVPAGLVYGAAAIALGVMAGTNEDFQNVVSNGVSAAGDWVQDGCVELLRVVDSTGSAMFYAAGDMLESLRSWFIDSDVISSAISDSLLLDDDIALAALSCPYSAIVVRSDMNGAVYYGRSTSPFYESTISGYKVLKTDSKWYYWLSTSNSWTSCESTSVLWCQPGSQSSYYSFGSSSSVDYFETSYDLSLGQISTVPIDGTSARTWAGDDVADRNGLYVKYNNDPEPPDDNNGKWFWKLALPVTAATLLAMSQADEWTGETPPEFSEYTTSTEFEILDQPEIDNYQGLELAPPGSGGGTAGDGDSDGNNQESTDPTTSPGGSPGTGGDTGTDTGGDSNPDSGSDPDTNPDTDPDADPDANPDTGQDPSTELNSDLNHFTLDLSKYFPFCIPFDLYDFFTCLNAAPKAPVISWEIPLPGGSTYPMEIDLSPFDEVAQLLRRLQLLLFCTGLAFKTRDLIKG